MSRASGVAVPARAEPDGTAPLTLLSPGLLPRYQPELSSEGSATSALASCTRQAGLHARCLCYGCSLSEQAVTNLSNRLIKPVRARHIRETTRQSTAPAFSRPHRCCSSRGCLVRTAAQKARSPNAPSASGSGMGGTEGYDRNTGISPPRICSSTSVARYVPPSQFHEPPTSETGAALTFFLCFVAPLL